MWTSFTSLFGKKHGYQPIMIEEPHAAPPAAPAAPAAAAAPPTAAPPAAPTSYLLTAASPRATQPPDAKVPLWPHQLAMLARCQQIEATPYYADSVVRYVERYRDGKPTFKPAPIGVMNDPPGAGKTFALLALILQDPRPGTNLIIVPQNIYCQWEAAIKTFYPHSNKVLYCNSYSVVSRLYMYPEVFADYSIILANDLYADQLAIGILDNKLPVRRLIVDEIDSIQKRLLNPIQADHVWLLSASFVHDEYLTIGPYKVKTEDMPHVICKCDHAFVANHFGIIDPATETIVCDDDDIQLFMGLVGDEVIAALNAGDSGPLLKTMNKVYPPEKRGLLDLAAARVLELRERATELERGADELVAMDMSGTEVATDPVMLKRQRERMRGEAAKMRADASVLEWRLTDISGNGRWAPSTSKTKAAVMASDICQRIKSTPTSRWLIFNDSHATLFATQRMLAAADISGLMIDAGNAAGIADAIASYKAGKYQVLLLNATTEGAGMNLENTTHMLFMHATNPGLVGQVVGRAQRFGRVGQLRIIGLFNRNEQP